MLFAYDIQCDNTCTVYVFKVEIMPLENLKFSKLAICDINGLLFIKAAHELSK